MEKLRVDWSRGMHAIIRCRTFCLSVCYPKYIQIKIYGTIILLVVLYGYETWSLTLREVSRLRVCENRVLRRICGPKGDKVTGVEKTTWRGALCSVLHTEYYSGDQMMKNEMGGANSSYLGEERCVQVFGEETWGNEATWNIQAWMGG